MSMKKNCDSIKRQLKITLYCFISLVGDSNDVKCILIVMQNKRKLRLSINTINYENAICKREKKVKINDE